MGRIERGYEIFKNGDVVAAGPPRKVYKVREYKVTHFLDNLDPRWSCTCPDNMYRNLNCKHIVAANLLELSEAQKHLNTIKLNIYMR